MEQSQSLKPGSTLRQGGYRIEKILGQGGFGITYLAYDVSLDRYVAIKEFFPRDFCDRDADSSHVTLGTQSATDLVGKLRTKFLKEARNIARLDHPYIIRIHAAFEENDTAYYVMDYIEGISVSEMVKRYGAIPAPRALEYIEKIGKALDYVHSFRINHLDVKPANIMVRVSNDTPLLIDFGLSKQYDSHGSQTSATPLGISAGYAPPEQYNQNGITEFSPATDVYSLGATLYYMLSGKVPPESMTLIHEELDFPASIPEALRGPIGKAMMVSKMHRYNSVGAFIDDLLGNATNSSQGATTFAANRNVNPPVPPMPQTPPSPPVPPVPPVPPISEPPAEVPPVSEPIQKPIPKPQEESKKPSKPSHNKKESKQEDAPAPKKNNRIVLFSAIGAIVIIGIVVAAIVLSGGGDKAGDNKSQQEAKTDGQDAQEVVTVSNMDYDPELADLGVCKYTGEINAVRQPNGKGKAVWATGFAESYDGDWKDGKMDGECVYVLRNGDTFEGTFKDNFYSEGKYTIKSSGEYFIGTFKESQPDQGKWYDASGKEI